MEGELTDKQRELLEALVSAPSVSAAAAELGMSRSNVYASLRRVGRKLGVSDVSELLRLLRDGSLTDALER
jgi:DNA-binding NarL/FixJ family response regulator